MRKLFLIPARGGSKGVPKKNIKNLKGKPLIQYSIEYARSFVDDEDICVSSDSDEIIKCVEELIGLKVMFKRPESLASDTAGTAGVIEHALNYFKKQDKEYDIVILLQPTSPFRRKEDLEKMLSLWNNDLDMLVSVKESHESPYFNLFEEDGKGYLRKSKELNIERRQDSPQVFAFNGSIYIYNVQHIISNSLNEMNIIKKYVMKDPVNSIDIDTNFDWLMAEVIIDNNLQ